MPGDERGARRTSIARAQDNLLRQQQPDGHWCGELMVDSTLCSDYVLFMHWVGEVDEAFQQRCVGAHPEAPAPRRRLEYLLRRSERGERVVLKRTSRSSSRATADAPFMQEARANILRLGGIPRMNTYQQALPGAASGSFPGNICRPFRWRWSSCRIGAFFNIYKMSSWSRAMLMPLAIINHFKPTRELPGDETDPRALSARHGAKDFTLPRDQRFFDLAQFFPAVPITS